MYAPQRPVTIPLEDLKDDSQAGQSDRNLVVRDEVWPFPIRFAVIAGLSLLCWAPIVAVIFFLL